FESSLQYPPVILTVDIVDNHKTPTQQMLAKVCSFLRCWPPTALSRLLQKQKRIFKDARVGQFKMLTEWIVLEDIDVSHTAERREEMLFGVRIVDRPPRLNDSVRSRAARRLVLDACHVKLDPR